MNLNAGVLSKISSLCRRRRIFSRLSSPKSAFESLATRHGATSIYEGPLEVFAMLNSGRRMGHLSTAAWGRLASVEKVIYGLESGCHGHPSF